MNYAPGSMRAPLPHRRRSAPCGVPAGETVVRAGDHGESLYLLVQGQVSISIDLANGGSVRVATLSAGMAFGEMVMLGEMVRSANVRAVPM